MSMCIWNYSVGWKTMQICCFKWPFKWVMIIISSTIMLMMTTLHMRSSEPRQSSRGRGVVTRESVHQCQVPLHKILCTPGTSGTMQFAHCTNTLCVLSHWTRYTVMKNNTKSGSPNHFSTQEGTFFDLKSAPNTLLQKKFSWKHALFSFNCGKTITQGSQTKSWR